MNKEKIRILQKPMSKKSLDELEVLQKHIESGEQIEPHPMVKEALKRIDESKETGSVALIVFKKGVSFDDRQIILHDFFVENQKKIKRMSYYELSTMELFEEVHKLIRDFGEEKATPKEKIDNSFKETNKEKFAKQYGWEKIKGKKVCHDGLNEEEYDETFWTKEALSDYVKECVFWQDTNSDRATEDIDQVIDWIEEDHDIVFIE